MNVINGFSRRVLFHGTEKLLAFKRDLYSEIPLLRPPKIQAFYSLKTLFRKFKQFSSSFSTPSVDLIRDHLWDFPDHFWTVPKVVLI